MALSKENYRKLSLAYRWHVEQARAAHKAGDKERERREELKATHIALDLMRDN